VIDGVTGVFFGEQSAESLKSAMQRLESMKFDKAVLRNHALKFSQDSFKGKIRKFVSEQHELFLKNQLSGIEVI
jgi:hypothetical protein